MTQTVTNHDEDLSYWKGLLREALANARSGLVETKIRKIANRAQKAGTLNVLLLRQLVRELDRLPIPGTPVPVKASTPVPEPKVRTNRFKGTCEFCGTLVQADEGILFRPENGGGKWAVIHATGQCIPEGRYAVDFDGDDNVKFFQLKGEDVYAQASDELHLLEGDVYISEVLAAIRADVKGAAVLYGQKLERCGICGRSLTHPESRTRGIGPDCAERMGWM